MANEKNKQTNNLFQYMVHQSPSLKNQRDEITTEENEQAKRYKDTLSNDIKELKSSIHQISLTQQQSQQSIQQLSTSVCEANMEIRKEITTALNTITETLKTLSAQVNDLHEKNKEKDIRINDMDNKINTLEQKIINKNIEIKNIQNKEIGANDVVKSIAATVNVEINDTDISNAYRLKRNDDKVIVEFCSLNKKNELMSKINKHRVEANVINNTNDNTNNDNRSNNFIYINDQLTPYNRHLLWLAKKKAEECKWKFVWVRNGQIFAKKNENTTALFIRNANDIEVIA